MSIPSTSNSSPISGADLAIWLILWVNRPPNSQIFGQCLVFNQGKSFPFRGHILKYTLPNNIFRCPHNIYQTATLNPSNCRRSVTTIANENLANCRYGKLANSKSHLVDKPDPAPGCRLSQRGNHDTHGQQHHQTTGNAASNPMCQHK